MAISKELMTTTLSIEVQSGVDKDRVIHHTRKKIFQVLTEMLHQKL